MTHRRPVLGASNLQARATGAGKAGSPRGPGQPSFGVFVLYALAAFVHSPALRAPLVADDYWQRAMIEGHVIPPRGPLDLYDFIDNATRPFLLARGSIPWWSDPHVVVRFLRPWPSFLLWADMKLWGDGTLLPHLHSYLWWALAVFGVYRLLRHSLSPRAAALAAAIFALSPCHTVPLYWLANRNVLTTVAIGAWALAFHVRSDQGSAPRRATIGAFLWAATLMTGEYALSFAGYVAAFEISVRQSWRPRIWRLAGFAVPAAAYLTVRWALGYAVHDSEAYRNPLDDPAAFLAGVPSALGLLLGSAWLGLEDWVITATPGWIVGTCGLALGFLAGLSLWTALREESTHERGGVLWLFVGSFLALVPVLSVVRPSMRLYAVAAIGVSASIATILIAGLDALGQLRDGGGSGPVSVPGAMAAVLALALAYLHFVHGPLRAYEFLRTCAKNEPIYERRLDWVRQHIDLSKTSTAIMLRATTPTVALYAPLMLRNVAPEQWRALTRTSGAISVRRTGPRSLEVTADPGDALISSVFAPSMHPGDSFEVPGMQASTAEVDGQGRPSKLDFVFDRDLDDPRLWWLVEGADGFREVTPPPLGHTLRVLP